MGKKTIMIIDDDMEKLLTTIEKFLFVLAVKA
jgi:hypothetical protein